MPADPSLGEVVLEAGLVVLFVASEPNGETPSAGEEAEAEPAAGEGTETGTPTALHKLTGGVVTLQAVDMARARFWSTGCPSGLLLVNRSHKHNSLLFMTDLNALQQSLGGFLPVPVMKSRHGDKPIRMFIQGDSEGPGAGAEAVTCARATAKFDTIKNVSNTLVKTIDGVLVSAIFPPLTEVL